MQGNGPAGQMGDGIACLDALAAQMHARGWSAYITTPAGRLACLFVQDPQDCAECGDIIAARDTTTGQWWYWFSWAERIAPAHVPAAAADVIISAFRRPSDDPPKPGPEPSRHPARGHPPAPPRHAPDLHHLSAGLSVLRLGDMASLLGPRTSANDTSAGGGKHSDDDRRPGTHPVPPMAC